MLITQKEIYKSCNEFGLIESNFKFLEKKFFFKKNYFYIYGPNNFFFQVDEKKNDLNNFFPYFNYQENYSNFQIWCSSIKETLVKSNKIVKDLKESKDLRDNFKKKYKV